VEFPDLPSQIAVEVASNIRSTIDEMDVGQLKNAVFNLMLVTMVPNDKSSQRRGSEKFYDIRTITCNELISPNQTTVTRQKNSSSK